LKGCVGNFGAERTFQAALALEQSGRRGDLTECNCLCSVLEEEMEALYPKLLRLGQ